MEQQADYKELAQFVDALIARKYPGEPAVKHQALREESITKLSDKINEAIFSRIGEDQADNLEALLDEKDGAKTPVDYLHFFQGAGIDIQQTIQDTMTSFGDDFLGGNNE